MDKQVKTRLQALESDFSKAVRAGNASAVVDILKSDEWSEVMTAEIRAKARENYEKQRAKSPNSAPQFTANCLLHLYMALETSRIGSEAHCSLLSAKIKHLTTLVETLGTQKDAVGQVDKLKQQLSAAQARIAALERKFS